MTDPRVDALFGFRGDDPGEPCPPPAALEALARGKGPEAVRAHVAACGACAAALRALLAGAPGRRLPLRRWARPAAAAAAVLLAALAVQFLTGPRREVTLYTEALVLAREGPAREPAPGAWLRPGRRFAAAGTTWIVLDKAGRIVTLPGGRVLAGDPLLAAVGRALGPEQERLRRRALGLRSPRPRVRRPDFAALWPRGGIAAVRPRFVFRAAAVPAGETLVIRVLDEEGRMALEQRVRAGREPRLEVPYPEGAAPLVRGRQYVWNVYHPRSGPGPLGGETFRVVAAAAAAAAAALAAALEPLAPRLGRPVVDLLLAAGWRRLGLHRRALERLPAEAEALPRPYRVFYLAERALLLETLGLGEELERVQGALRAARP